MVWKRDIGWGRKALDLKAGDVDQIHYCQLGKMVFSSCANPKEPVKANQMTITKNFALMRLFLSSAYGEAKGAESSDHGRTPDGGRDEFAALNERCRGQRYEGLWFRAAKAWMIS